MYQNVFNIKIVQCDSNQNSSNSSHIHKSLTAVIQDSITQKMNVPNYNQSNPEPRDTTIPVLGWTISKKFKNHILYEMDWKRKVS